MKRIGYSSHCFSRALPIEEIIQFGLDHRFNALELNVDQTTFGPQIVKDSTVRWLRGISESGEVRFSMHGPEDVNFGASSCEARDEAVARTEAALALAAQLRIATVVVHPGRVMDGGGEGQHLAQALQHTVAALGRCAETGQSLGVAVSVENLCHVKGTVAPSIRSFFQMCQMVGLAKIAVTLDTGHTFVDGLEMTLAVIGARVNHIHINDNSGLKSEHLELGRGSIDFPAMAPYLKAFEGNINIELKRTAADNSKEQDGGPVLRSRDYLLQLLEDRS